MNKKQKFPYGINKEMDEHAASKGFSHWSCVSPRSNEWWVRDDGATVQATFGSRRGYIDDLDRIDKQFPRKPPLGVCPRYVWGTLRIEELQQAIDRYTDAGFQVPEEWTVELKELLECV